MWTCLCVCSKSHLPVKPNGNCLRDAYLLQEMFHKQTRAHFYLNPLGVSVLHQNCSSGRRIISETPSYHSFSNLQSGGFCLTISIRFLHPLHIVIDERGEKGTQIWTSLLSSLFVSLYRNYFCHPIFNDRCISLPLWRPAFHFAFWLWLFATGINTFVSWRAQTTCCSMYLVLLEHNSIFTSRASPRHFGALSG